MLGQEEYGRALARAVRGAPTACSCSHSRDDIPAVVADLDVLAMPSVEPESYGLVLVEALASGVPVVATDHGGPPELAARAEPGSARLVPPGDVAGLADALLALLPARTSTAARQRRTRKLTLPPPRFADLFRQVARPR